ncbi:SLAP domain-containing protein, partial [Lactobacillus helveticus]
LGGGAYIKAANVDGKAEESEDSTSVKLIHNAYVYDENGKRIKKYEGKAKLTKGTEIDVYGTKTIKGTKYYALKPNHYYVKGSDVTVK